MKKFPIIEPAIIILIGIVMFVGSIPIKSATSISVGPDFMPKLIGVLFVIFGCALIPECLKKQKEVSAALKDAPPKEKRSFNQIVKDNVHFITWGWMLIYALLWKPLGFLFASILFMFGAMYLLTIRMEKRNWLVISLVSIIVPTVIYIVFRKEFYLMLPMGLCRYIPLAILK